MDISEIVYKGRDNTFALTVKQGGELVDFSAATSFELTLGGSIITNGITGDALGEITFALGDASVEPGTYTAKLVVIDADHPLGQVVFDKNSKQKVKIKVV